MNPNLILVAVATLLSVLPAAQAVVISSFGETDFTVDYGTSTFASIITHPDNVEVSGTDFGESMAGTFVPVDISGLSRISLTGTVNGDNPDSAFTVLLFNSTFDQSREYSGNMSSFGSTSSSLLLSFVSESSSFTDVAGFQFIGGGSGSPLEFTFEELSATAVPEPSVPALFALSLGAFFWSRRLAQSKIRWLLG